MKYRKIRAFQSYLHGHSVKVYKAYLDNAGVVYGRNCGKTTMVDSLLLKAAQSPFVDVSSLKRKSDLRYPFLKLPTVV